MRCFIFVCCLVLAQGAEPDAPKPPPTQDSPAGGTVNGTVRYQADPDRPWRLGRYYIKDPNAGWLAESVVALVGAGLSADARATVNATNVVDQRDFMFVPETVAVRVGDSVKFTNSDDSMHNVMTNDGDSPFNINMLKGDEHIETFARAGGLAKPIRLGCVYHGGMRGWVYVFDHPFFQVTQANGQFAFQQVPPGEYTLQVIHPAGRLTSKQTVVVQSGQTLTREFVLTPQQ